VNKKWLVLAGLLFVVSALVSCGVVGTVVDWVFGIETEVDPETGAETPIRKDGSAPIDFLGTVFPAFAGIGALGRWFYTEVRTRKLDGSVKAVVAGVKKAVDNGVDKDTIYPFITEMSKLYAHREFFEQAIARIKTELKAKEA